MVCSVDSLKFVASWKGRLQEAKLQIKVLDWFYIFIWVKDYISTNYDKEILLQSQSHKK